MRKIIILQIMLFCCTALLCQDIIKQKMEIVIDGKGDAQINTSMTLNATQWQMWFNTMGKNQAMLKREMERNLPAYFLEDFKLEINEMERSFELNFRAVGFCNVNKAGKWVVNTDQKDIDITEVSRNRYMAVAMLPGTNIQQTQFIEFPQKAKDIKIIKDAFAKTQFEFEMPSSGGINIFMIAAGILLALAGAALWYRFVKLP